MRVLFIYPNLYAQVGFNYGVAYLSGTLKAHGHQTKLININEKVNPVPTDDELLQEVRAYQPGLVGFSVVTNQYREALRIAKLIKAELEVPLICGGVHASMVPEEVLASGVFDYVCVGEGEGALLELVEKLEKGEDTTSTANIWCRKDGRIIANKVRPFVPLDELAPMDYEVLDFQRLIDAKRGWVGAMASRGCPYRCSYCFNHRMVEIYRKDIGVPAGRLGYIRHRDPASVIAELEWLLSRYRNISTYIFDDDLFTVDKNHLLELCRLYREKVKVPFVCNAHVGKFDQEIARALKDAGCKIVKFGIESGSPRVRREVMNRYMTNEQIKLALRQAQEAGLHTSAFVMIGLPTETREEVLETVELLAQTRPGRFRWAVFFPYPGTHAYQMAEELDIIDHCRMAELTNFTDASCLELGKEQNLFIDKLSQAFPWYVNGRGDFSASKIYENLADNLDKLSDADWQKVRGEVASFDRQLSGWLGASGQEHYAIRYDKTMAVSSSFLLAEEQEFGE